MSKHDILDGNTAAASMAFILNEVIAIYPITPSSTMAELCDAWMSGGKKNIYGAVPSVMEMQSEAGAAGTVHGSLMAGALTTTFTSSQGLLLMIPNMYKIAGELHPAVFMVAARSLAAQALSIFGDHQDVMSVRGTGWALLSASNVQEVQDFTVVANMATLASRVPIISFFDGFRTSHEIQKINVLDTPEVSGLIDRDLVAAVKARSLSPETPTARGTAQNPDIYFQARERANPFYQKFPEIIKESFARFAKLTGRSYNLFDYYGHPQAELVVTLMGSGNSVVEEAVDYLNRNGYRVGLVKTRLFRPFDSAAFAAALPKSVRRVIVLDRTKEPGSNGEPLYLEVLHALRSMRDIEIFGGRYGLSSKEFTPTHVKTVFDNFALDRQELPEHGFTVGIDDDVTHLSLTPSADIDAENADVYRAKFYGLGSDGTVGASKNTIKIIGDLTDNSVQGYFVYDSKKAGAMTISHLRFSKTPIRSSYLITRPNFVAIHQTSFLGRVSMLDGIQEGGSVLLNSQYEAETAFSALPRDMQNVIVAKKLKFYVIDAHKIASECGLKGRINSVMQAAFFKISNIIPADQYFPALEKGLRSSYGKKGDEVVNMNLKALQRGLDEVLTAKVPETISADTQSLEVDADPTNVPDFVKDLLFPIMKNLGDQLPVSAMSVDGVFPVGGSQYEKRAIATQLPSWIGSGIGDSRVCIQCNLCAFVCPHAAIRPGIIDDADLAGAPQDYEVMDIKSPSGLKQHYRIQLYPEDCTGCDACVQVCPGWEKDPATKEKTGRRSLTMVPAHEIMAKEKKYLTFFQSIKTATADEYISNKSVKASQYAKPLFEFSSACSGCGETPYIKLLTQLCGDRLYMANATGCSSIYGGTAPAIPYTKNQAGRGPAWANSLFEDNAEFGLGMRLAVNHRRKDAFRHLEKLVNANLGELSALATSAMTFEALTSSESAAEVRSAIDAVLKLADAKQSDIAKILGADYLAQLKTVAANLVPKSVWCVGGDGWAYDIGFGGLDHILASGENINILVLDTQVYSNTGGQNSKATPLGAIAKFAASGKGISSKKLATHAMNYRNVYVAQICYGANPTQTLKAFTEAENYNGPSLLIAYSPCGEHGYDMTKTGTHMESAVECGFWPLYRHDPRRLAAGESALKLDSSEPKGDLHDFMLAENRFRTLYNKDPKRFSQLTDLAKADLARQWEYLKLMAGGE